MIIKVRRILKSISTKVIFVIILLILPLNLIAISQNNSVMNTMIEHTKLSSQSITDAYMSEIGARMGNTQSLLYYFLTESADFHEMKQQNENAYEYMSVKYKFFYSLRNMARLTDGGDGYFYHMKKVKDTLVYDAYPTQSGQVYRFMNTFIEEQLQKGIKSGWHIYELNSRKYLVFMVNLYDVAYGGWFNLDNLKVRLENRIGYKDFSVSFSEDKEKQSNETWLRVSTGKKGIFLNIDLSRDEITGNMSIYQKILQTMVFVYLILIPVLFFFLRLILIRPLNKIRYAHRQIQSGNQNFRITDTIKSVEYGEVYQSFNQMAEKLKMLKIESYEKEISKQKMEIRNLQLQIRPHFLLNTFNLIYTMAQRKEVLEIQEVILYLSDYFRYIFRSDRERELFPKELKLIEGYMKMVSIQYPGNIEVEYEFDPEIDYVRLPPLLIHNFIENSVKYGIKQGSVLHISIIGQYMDKIVTFYVVDDGNGMDFESLEYYNKLIRGELEPVNPSQHVGLLNSIKRLKYFYGEEADMEITSEPGVMTCVKMAFPYNLEVDDESFNGQR